LSKIKDNKKKSEENKQDSNLGNLGQPVFDINNGGISIGIGSGLTIDPTDGSLGISIGPGIGIDF
jgi:hypothetical protein